MLTVHNLGIILFFDRNERPVRAVITHKKYKNKAVI